MPRVLVDEDDSGAGLRRLERRGAARRAATDDEHARPAMLGVVAAGVPRVRIELPETGSATQELLVQRPGGARADERAVVEADRRERAADLVRQRHEVEVERPADVLSLDDGALADRLGADADVRHAVDRHLAVRAVARAAEEPARAVVLERAREDALAGGEGSRRDRVALEARDLPARERERDRLQRSIRSPARGSSLTPASSARGGSPRAPRSSACRARRGTTRRTRSGAATTRAARRRRCRGSTRSRSAHAGSASPTVAS